MTTQSLEWEAACEVQRRFMQSAGDEDISARCRQMQELGGDFYELTSIADHRLAIAIGDASGKGLAAALMIANVQSSLRTAASFTGYDGAATLGAVNRQVYESSLADRYATLFYGIFDRDTRMLRYVNAGHNPPMVIRRDGSVVWLESGGAPAGMFSDWNYEEGVVALNPGEVLIAWTDGVVEAVNPAGEEWGVEGLFEAASQTGGRTAEEIVRAIFASMDAFSEGRQGDDATVVVLRVR
jgi:phosphoserine phosphatase RsbU/P